MIILMIKGGKQMKNISKHIPGFRSNTGWKKAVAIVYYLCCIFMLFYGVGAFLMLAAIPFVAFALIGVLKYRIKRLFKL